MSIKREFKGILATIPFFTIFALTVFVIPSQIERSASHTDETFSIATSNSIDLADVNFHFSVVEEKQSVLIYYNLYHTEKKPSFISLIMPYNGTLYEKTGEWKTKQFPEFGYTVIYRYYDCEEICPRDEQNMSFVFEKKLDSKYSYLYSIGLPFGNNPLKSELTNYIDSIKPNGTSFTYGWQKVKNPTEIRLTIDWVFDEIDTIPVAYLEPLANREEGTNYVVIHWNVSKNRELFHSNYNSSEERVLWDRLTNFGYISFGAGTTLLATSIAFVRFGYDKKDIINWIKKIYYKISDVKS